MEKKDISLVQAQVRRRNPEGGKKKKFPHSASWSLISFLQFKLIAQSFLNPFTPKSATYRFYSVLRQTILLVNGEPHRGERVNFPPLMAKSTPLGEKLLLL